MCICFTCFKIVQWNNRVVFGLVFICQGGKRKNKTSVEVVWTIMIKLIADGVLMIKIAE